jgi:proline-specific peptidase
MSAAHTVHEGYVPFRGFRVWFKIVGDGEEPGKLPLLCLHGGPGAPCDYLQPLEEIAATGRRVIFYDQLGCGRSDQPSDPAMWTVPLFVEEVGVVRQALGLERLHLLGQSWGGMLAMEYALTQPAGLASLIVASSPASIPQWMDEANRLRVGLPPPVQETLRRHEQAGTYSAPEYQQAAMLFYRRHLCRLDPWPDFFVRSFERIRQEIYVTMFGPSEFLATGTLKDWDITSRLGEIRVPTLVTSGRYDEATPTVAETVQRGIRGAEWVLFENSSHSAHIEEADRYRRILDRFLCRVEATAPS